MADIESLTAHDLAEIRTALLKAPTARSYDDLLLLKSYITKTEFVTKNLAGIVNPKQMNDICKGMTLESYQAGEIVFNQGDIGDKIYVLLSGSCEVRVKYKIDLTQGETEIREKLVVTYKDGQFFGERALHNDDPRSATVICKTASDLVAVSKVCYLNVLSDAQRENNLGPSKDVLGTKESVISLLSKMREKRSNQELDAVAAYLWRRIPFFQKFTPTQLIELCRVAETISVWGKSILFKQGQMGQAFYVILTGSVEVWVQENNAEAPAEPVARPTGNGRRGELFEDLGIKVNQLVSGDVFGERALESESSQRMASISTCEDLTELLVIAKEDYHNLVYVMMHADSMQRLTLLRKTELFRSVDVVHLKALARFMEPRKYAIDEPLFVAGRKATEMIIIDVGECRAETVIREGFERMTEEEKREFHSKHYMQSTHEDHPHAGHEVLHRHFDLYAHSHPVDEHKKKVEAARRAREAAREAAAGDHPPIHPHQHHHHSHGHHSHHGHAQVHYPPMQHKVSTVPASDHDKHYVAHLDFRADSFRPDVDLLHRGHHHSHDSLPSIHHNFSNSRPSSAHGHSTAAATAAHKREPVVEIAPAFASEIDDIKSTKASLSLVPLEEMAGRARMKRVNTSDLIPYGDLKTVNLGRIAPASVLATYITKCETIHNEVYHPETVVASTLVTAYTIGKHDFFNHMPKDTRSALTKIIAEYQTPMLNTLWENVPRILDEDEWKKSKTWEIYIDQVVHSKKSANIFHTYQALSKFHISSNSGNNAQTKIAMKNEMLMRNTDTYTFQKARVDVTMDWGLKSPSPSVSENNTVVPITVTAANSALNSVAHSAKHSHSVSPLTVTVPPPTVATVVVPVTPVVTHQSTSALTAMDGKILPSILEDTSLVSSAVSKMIRNRINYSHFSEKQNATATGSAKPTQSVTDIVERRRPQSASGSLKSSSRTVATTDRLSTGGSSGSSGGLSDNPASNMPFFLIQIHRESTSRASGVPNMFDANGRGVKCYLRLCGAFTSCAASKESADNQMENIYLTLFRSEAAREKELVLHWTPFRGWDSVPLTESDHFVIYCRSTPLECASITPSKNMFNAAFPALCKRDGQRFSCIVSNVLSEAVPAKTVTLKTESIDDDDSLTSLVKPSVRAKARSSVIVTSAGANNEAAQAAVSALHSVPSAQSLMISVPAPAEAAVTPVKKPIVPYLLEFSVLNEVLITTSNRLDCIRYAIQKFGSFTESDDPLSSPTRALLNSTTGIGGSSALGQKIYLRKVGQHSLAGSTSQNVERILSVANSENKRICVVPLFQWLLVNEDTFKSLDFVNAFSEEAQKSTAAEADEDEMARSQRLNGKSLEHSFSEAGFLTTKYATRSSRNSPERNAQVRADDGEEGGVEGGVAELKANLSRSLALLERDLQAKELSKRVLRQSQSNAELHSRKKPASPQVNGIAGGSPHHFDSHTRPVDWGFAPGSRPVLPHTESSRPGIASAGGEEIDPSGGGGVGSIRLEARLKKLNDSFEARSQFIANSSRLNDDEHALMAKLNVSKAKVRVATPDLVTELGNANALSSKNEQRDIMSKIEKRTDVAYSIHAVSYSRSAKEPLQHLSAPPQDSSGGGGGELRASPQRRMSVSLSKVGKVPGYASASGIREPAPMQAAGSVGKRIAENIRLLGESSKMPM